MTDQSKFDLKFSLNKDQMQNIEHKGMVEQGRSCTNWGHKQKKYGGPYRNIKTLKMRRNSVKTIFFSY